MIDTLRAVDVDAMTRPRLESIITDLQALESAAVARRLAAMAALDALGDGGLPSETVVRSHGRASARKAKREKHTATKLDEMPATRAKLERGVITPEHADAAADAAERCGDPATADAELAGKADIPADLFARRAKEWADTHESQSETDARARRQHRNRRVGFGTSKDDGSWTMFAAGERSEGRELQGLIEAEADRLYRDDGGRENPRRPRTDDQRRFDALAALVRRGAGLDTTARPGKRPHPKYQATVTIPLSAYLDPEHAAGEFVGSGPLPRSVVQRILCDGELLGLVVDDGGQPLYAGRAVRTANDTQWKALIARDGGCVVCGADPSRCEAHHLIWWERGGPTDITNLVLLCTRHHHELHDHNQELVKRDGAWRLRPRSRAGPPTRSSDRRARRGRRGGGRRSPARALT